MTMQEYFQIPLVSTCNVQLFQCCEDLCSCRDLGNNKGTRSMTRSKLDEDTEMDVRSDKEG